MSQPIDHHPLKRLLQYARPWHSDIGWATLYSILNKLFDLAPPLLIGMAVEIVAAQETSLLARYGITDVAQQLAVLAVLTVAIWGGESLFEYAYALKWRNLAQAIQHTLRLDAYRHVQGLEMAFFEDQSTGGLMAVLNDDINQLERFLDGGANDLIQLIITIVSISIFFIIQAPSVAWMAILPMPFVFFGSMAFQKRLAPRYRAVRERVGDLNGRLSTNLSGIATIKSFTTETYEAGRIEQESQLYSASNQHAIRLSAAFVPVIRMLIVVGFAAVLFFGGLQAARGEMNIGIYSVLIFMTQRLLWPMTRLGTMLDLYQRAMASTARVMQLLDTKPHIHDGKTALPLKTVAGSVIFEQVNFSYGLKNGQIPKNNPAIIKNLSLNIKAGQTVAIVGSTGSGKTTLIKLLLRFYDVTGGQILLDGVPLASLRRPDLRAAIGLVSQDVFLFHGTVRENIAYGTFAATEAEIEQAAKIAEAHQFILGLVDGYDTIVGERGQKLSGGQRQRISIARAVLKDPPVLILDEATSAVDNETEAAIQRSMQKIVIGRTTIVIAHRLSTIRNADQIFVLDHGELSEHGKHDELVAADGIYAALWRVQTGERV